MKKEEALRRWRNLDEGRNPLRHMTPIRPGSRGSSYGACGVRIDGNPAFVDAVLALLKPLLAGENQVTRLGLSRNPVDHEFKPGLEKAEAHAEVCYIRLHLRGPEGAMASAVFDRHLKGATEEYAKALGLDVEGEAR
jgi:hypothetical protein